MTNTLLSSLFKQTIANRLSLERNGINYPFHEGEIDYLFVLKAEDGFAFKLDDDENFKCFDGSRLKGVAMRCDVVFVVHMNGEDYIIVTEFKSGNKGDYKKQLLNGRHFCQWVVNLLKEHGYYCQNPKYIGLLVWKVNPKQPLKRPSVRRDPKPIEYKGIPIHKRTDRKIDLHELIV